MRMRWRERFSAILKEPKLLLEQRIAALEKSKQFTLDHLSANLLRLEAALGDKR